MLTCITCFNQSNKATGDDQPGGGGDDEFTAPRPPPPPPVRVTSDANKAAVKTLAAQIKDIVLKVSGSYKCKSGGEVEINCGKGERPYKDFRASSYGFPYHNVQHPGTSSSTIARDFTSSAHHASRLDSRFPSLLGDQTRAGLESNSVCSGEMALDGEDTPQEWTAQVEPGVHITFVSLPSTRGGNDLKRIRFSREMFDKAQAQRWWSENYDRIMELYNVQRLNHQELSTPGRPEDGRDSTYSKLGLARESPRIPSFNNEWTPRYKPFGDDTQHCSARTTGHTSSASKGVLQHTGASIATISTRDDAAVATRNASNTSSEWIEEDEPGVYITIRQLADDTRELRRVRFSREKFGEVNAKLWWETNRDRIMSQYLRE